MHFNSRLFIYPYIHGCFPGHLTEERDKRAVTGKSERLCNITAAVFFRQKFNRFY